MKIKLLSIIILALAIFIGIYNRDMIGSKIVEQLGNPSGTFGSTIMSRFFGIVNGKAISWIIDHLPYENRKNEICELGFGPGDSMEYILKEKSPFVERISGIEISQEMIDYTTKRLQSNDHHYHTSVQLVNANVCDKNFSNPFGSNQFDIVFHFNVVYFWRQNSLQAFKNVLHLLKPHGKHVTCMRVRNLQVMKTVTGDQFPQITLQQIKENIISAGGYSDKISEFSDKSLDVHCIVAQKKSIGSTIS